MEDMEASGTATTRRRRRRRGEEPDDDEYDMGCSSAKTTATATDYSNLA
jgi:hypothetical protein